MKQESYKFAVIPAFPHASCNRGFTRTLCHTREQAEIEVKNMEYYTQSPWLIIEI